MAAGHAVLISGDFNRDLRQELRQGLPARGDGSPAAAPIRTSDEMRRVANVLPERDLVVEFSVRMKIGRAHV